tara:strand:- start:2307 stop:3758 length:1452 start_codon:yes stop_codon:yes gene_type:complete
MTNHKNNGSPRIGIASYYTNNRGIIIILGMALVLRLAFFLVTQPWEDNVLKSKILIGDAHGYNRLAEELIDSGTLKSTYSQFRTPGYPYFISIIYSTFGHNPWIILLIQNIINLLTLLGVYYFSALVFNDKTLSHIAAVLYLLDPLPVYYSTTLLTETFFSTLLLYSIFSGFKGLQKEQLRYFIICGLFLGIGTLIRPITLYFPLIVTIIVLMWPQLNRLFRVYSILLFVITFSMMILPWMIRNYYQYGYFSLTSIRGYNLLFYSAVATEYNKTGRSYPELRRDFTHKAIALGATGGEPTFKDSKIHNRIAFNYLKNNWKTYLPLHLRGMIAIFLDPGIVGMCDYLGLKHKKFYVKYNAEYTSLFGMIIGYFKLKPISEIIVSIPVIIYLGIIYFSFIVGFIYMVRDKEYALIIFLSFIIIYFTILPGVIGHARYRVPIIPYYLLFSVYGMLKILNRNKQHTLKLYFGKRPSGNVLSKYEKTY